MTPKLSLKPIIELTQEQAEEILRDCLDYETWSAKLSFNPVVGANGHQQLTFSGNSIVGITFKFGTNNDGGVLRFDDLRVIMWLAERGYDVSSLLDSCIATEKEDDECRKIVFEQRKEMNKDLSSLVENFWYILRTRDSTLSPKELTDWENYTKELGKKYEVF